MKKNEKLSIKMQILRRLKKMRTHVVLRADFESLGSYRQISRGLKELQAEGVLVKIGQGIYAKAYRSKYTNKPMIDGSFEIACQEALNRLGVKWSLGSAITDYNEGRTTQVPARLTVKLKTRFRRTLAYGKNKMIIEKRAYGR